MKYCSRLFTCPSFPTIGLLPLVFQLSAIPITETVGKRIPIFVTEAETGDSKACIQTSFLSSCQGDMILTG